MKALVITEKEVNAGRNPEFYAQRENMFFIKTWGEETEDALRRKASYEFNNVKSLMYGNINECDPAKFDNDMIVVVSDITEKYLNLVGNNSFYLGGIIENSIFHIIDHRNGQKMTQERIDDLEMIFSE